jgi:hypothetical protein
VPFIVVTRAHFVRHGAQPVLHRGLQHDDAQVERNAVEAAAEHDARAARPRGGVEPRDHRVHPQRLAAEVDVVAAGLGAGGHERLAVLLVRADGGDHHAGLAHQRRQRGSVGGIGHAQRQVGRRADRVAHLREPGRIAAGQRPAHAGRKRALQMFGHQPAGESGGAEEHEVEAGSHGGTRRQCGCVEPTRIRA